MKTINPMNKYIEEWKKSGQSISSFCKAKSISKHKFDYWRIRKYQRQGNSLPVPGHTKSSSTLNFLPVKVKEEKKFLLEIKIEASGNILLRIGESDDIS